MIEYEWDETLSTGDTLVDEQHRSIHELVCSLERGGDDPKLLMSVLDRLMEHIDCHFTTEEALMKRTGFDSARVSDHIDQHRQLTARARDMFLQYRCGQLSEMEPVAELLRDWLRIHVRDHDRELIEHVRGVGASASLPEPWASNTPE